MSIAEIKSQANSMSFQKAENVLSLENILFS